MICPTGIKPENSLIFGNLAIMCNRLTRTNLLRCPDVIPSKNRYCRYILSNNVLNMSKAKSNYDRTAVSVLQI